jgi:1-acyl-sn-glycerol-3-phosphate acyltransferase
MERWSLAAPPRWWSPKLSPFWVRLCRPFRLHKQWREHLLREVQVRGLEHLRAAVDQGGVLLTPNHAGHADGYVLSRAGDQLGRPCYFMVAWQVLAKHGFLGRQALRYHGCFSVDREGNDLRAFRQAVDILRASPYPLVIFPEGEVYHVNDRVTPFREGPAVIALSATKRATRPVLCVPAAIKYQYLEDPTPRLHELMDRLERRLLWRPRPELPLLERVTRFSECLLTLKELEHLGRAQSGTLAERLAALTDTLLGRIESRRGEHTDSATVPERVKALRQQILKGLPELPPEDPRRREADRDLDDLFAVVQLFSYPGDYLAERPTIERLAETMDKFEEDVFHVPTATPRAARRAVIAFGEPIPAEQQPRKKEGAAVLTDLLERRVQALLDEIGPASGTPGR